MPKSSEHTTKFKVDISELKTAMQEARKQVAYANSEFKAASSSMDDWSSSGNGLNAKLEQLESKLKAQKTVLEEYERVLEEVKKKYGENSAEAMEYATKLNNQQAVVNGLEKEIRNYSGRLAEVSEAEKEAARTGKSVEEALRDMDDASKNAEESAGDLSEGYTVLKGALANLLADGIRAVIGGLKEFVTESESAYNKFQAATGASTEEMQGFKEEMNDLYNSAFGDSLTDIGDKMAYIKQVTGETDPKKIRELTENVMTLEDTFGTDFNETIRGVKNLMEHFGIEATEAFDLYAKGCQEGLDYTGELGDNIAEYGGNFQQAGYSTEEYFQILKNGTANGAYNLDKVNDSINEVKNRIADGTIEENLSIFSENTQTLFKNWQNGEGTMKDVINSIVGDINNCQNEQEALTMAATAFGTMGEDANLKVVKSLTTVGDNFKDVKGTMNDVKKIRYDDVGTQFKELGRKMKTELIQPLVKEALPYAKELGNFMIKNLDKIIPLVKTLGVTFGAAFATNKIITFAGTVTNVITSIAGLTTATTAAKTATTGLNTAWGASPIGLAVTAVVALGAGVAYLAEEEKKAIEKEYGLTEAQKESIEVTHEKYEAYKQMDEAREKSMEGIVAEYGYLDELKTELQGLVDSNGQVKAGYEDRANFIVTQLADALGLEKDKIWEIIQTNGDLGESIDQIIEKKKAEALLNANEEGYTEAIKNRNEALQDYQEKLSIYDEAKKKMEESEAAVKKYYDYIETNQVEKAVEFKAANEELIDGYKIIKESFNDAKTAVEESEEVYVGYCATIQNYEGLSSAIISGDAAKIQEAMMNVQNSFITAETGTKQSLENQVNNLKKNYEDMKTAIANNTPGVTQEMVDQAKQMVDMAEIELAKLETAAGAASGAAGVAYAMELANQTPGVMTAAFGVATAANSALGSADTSATGSSKIAELVSGMGSQMGNVAATGRALGNAGASAAGEADYYSKGVNSGTGFSNGLSSTIQSIKNTAASIASNVLKTLREGLDIHSPSRETFKIGDYAVQGLQNALAAGARKMVEPTKKIAAAILDTANEELGVGIDIPDLNGVKASVRSAGSGNSGNTNTVNNGTTKVVNNFYQTNNSPKALSRLEIYRQTKNILGYCGGNK